MKKTKANLLQATLDLFNELGFVNVRLQHIADKADVSIGNLAYHFATKKHLLRGVYQDLVLRQAELLNELNIVPIFENIDRHWDNVFKIQKMYSFFYQDTLEVIRFDEHIKNQYRKHVLWEKDQLERLLSFNTSRGALIFNDEQDELKRKAELIWLTENSWFQ